MDKNQKNNIEIEVRSIVSDLAIRQQEDGKPSRVITGYASKFDTWSEPIYGWFVEKIARGAFEKTDSHHSHHPHYRCRRYSPLL